MQDDYVGDIGDFAKYGLLRALTLGKRLGVAWYRNHTAGAPGDGRHREYLDRPDEFRALDSDLFDALKTTDRSVEAVQRSGILENAVFAGDPLDIPRRIKCRASWRRDWFTRVMERLGGL